MGLSPLPSSRTEEGGIETFGIHPFMLPYRDK